MPAAPNRRAPSLDSKRYSSTIKCFVSSFWSAFFGLVLKSFGETSSDNEFKSSKNWLKVIAFIRLVLVCSVVEIMIDKSF